jgi:hypothetical protein
MTKSAYNNKIIKSEGPLEKIIPEESSKMSYLSVTTGKATF